MKKIGKFVKRNMIGFIIGFIIAGAIGVYAATIASSNISYDNSTSGLTATNAQDAIDEIFSSRKPPIGSEYLLSLGSYTFEWADLTNYSIWHVYRVDRDYVYISSFRLLNLSFDEEKTWDQLKPTLDSIIGTTLSNGWEVGIYPSHEVAPSTWGQYSCTYSGTATERVYFGTEYSNTIRSGVDSNDVPQDYYMYAGYTSKVKSSSCSNASYQTSKVVRVYAAGNSSLWCPYYKQTSSRIYTKFSSINVKLSLKIPKSEFQNNSSIVLQELK